MKINYTGKPYRPGMWTLSIRHDYKWEDRHMFATESGMRRFMKEDKNFNDIIRTKVLRVSTISPEGEQEIVVAWGLQ